MRSVVFSLKVRNGRWFRRRRLSHVALYVLATLWTLNAPPAVATADDGYRLPWRAGIAFSVVQGWGGAFSHNSTQQYYGYDFVIPEGTELLAAKGGVVTAAEGRYSECGRESRLLNLGNRVTIQHNDGSSTLYLHLLSVRVSNGQSVQQGQVVGLSGKTGFTGCSPHLHFQRQAQGIWITNSRPVYFDEYAGQQLAVGRSYTSQNGAGAPQNPIPPPPPPPSAPYPSDQEGALARAPDGSPWLFEGGKRRHVPDNETLQSIYDRNGRRYVQWNDDLYRIPQGDSVPTVRAVPPPPPAQGRSPERRAGSGFDAAFSGESAFLALASGEAGQFAVFFTNTGTVSWIKGTATQVDLAACLEDKATCNALPSRLAGWNSGSWARAVRYATQTQPVVGPGQIATFVYQIRVPQGASGTYRFFGELVVSESGLTVHPEGYYHEVTVR